jgi:hypothetical protein
MRRLLLVLGLCVLLQPTLRADSKDTKDVPEGFTSLFNGKDLTGWKSTGKMEVWGVDNGLLYVKGGGGGWLLSDQEYGDYELRLEFKLPKAGNSGVATRAPFKGDPAYSGIEIQLLDDAWYKDKNNYKAGIKDVQLTGAIYGVVPPSKDATKPAGEWNTMRIVAKGRHLTIELNGVKTIDADLDKYKEHEKAHPGLLREKGHVGFQSHDGRVEFRHIYIKTL